MCFWSGGELHRNHEGLQQPPTPPLRPGRRRPRALCVQQRRRVLKLLPRHQLPRLGLHPRPRRGEHPGPRLQLAGTPRHTPLHRAGQPKRTAARRKDLRPPRTPPPGHAGRAPRPVPAARRGPGSRARPPSRGLPGPGPPSCGPRRSRPATPCSRPPRPSLHGDAAGRALDASNGALIDLVRDIGTGHADAYGAADRIRSWRLP